MALPDLDAQIRLIAASPLFDAAWYVSRYPDVAGSGMAPVRHFLLYGTLFQRAPGPEFDSRFYLETCPEAAGSNALLHYLLQGQAEGRAIRPAAAAADAAPAQPAPPPAEPPPQAAAGEAGPLILDGEPPAGPLPADALAVFIRVDATTDWLPALIGHYRDLGVDAVFLLAGSEMPQGDALPQGGDGVHVIRHRQDAAPEAALKALIDRHLAEGCWHLVVGSDEFVQVPEGFADFRDLAEHFDCSGLDHAAGLILDLLPAPDSPPAEPGSPPAARMARCSHICNAEGEIDAAYAAHPVIAADFGEKAGLSWRVDAAYHAGGPVSALRRIPLLRHRSDRSLEGGRRHFTPAEAGDDPAAFWQTWPVLPVFRYAQADQPPAGPVLGPVAALLATGFPN